MTKSEHQQRVEQFMQLAGQEIPSTPQIPSKEVRLLRAKLILEEALETVHALGFSLEMDGSFEGKEDIYLERFQFCDDQSVSLEEIADGCADISVVTIGTLSACGIHDTELLELVDASNLAKFEVPKCHLHPTLIMAHIGEGKYVCKGWLETPKEPCPTWEDGPYKRADGKWVKSPAWKKPDIARLLLIQSTVNNIYAELIREEKNAQYAQYAHGYGGTEAGQKLWQEAVAEPDIWIKEVELKQLKEEIVQEAVDRITKMWEEKCPAQLQTGWSRAKNDTYTEILSQLSGMGFQYPKEFCIFLKNEINSLVAKVQK